MNILELFESINTFVFDIDGVMTDGSLLVTDTGDLLRSMNIRDGYATELAVQKGYHVWVISGGKQEAPAIRLRKLGVKEAHIAIPNKKTLLLELFKKYDVNPNHALYMGDDMPDYAVMQICGLPTCPNDAAPEIKSVSKYISPFKGGGGCVRDVIEKVLKLKGDWELPQ
ncbi:MAG: HAD hydrolase family protein [Phycisphaerales bacterium]|nr:HAD hydrolase family protein [Phycisphaerales bacterium]